MDILLIQMELFKNGIQEVQLVCETGPCPAPLRDTNPSETELKTEAAKQSVLFLKCAGALSIAGAKVSSTVLLEDRECWSSSAHCSNGTLQTAEVE